MWQPVRVVGPATPRLTCVAAVAALVAACGSPPPTPRTPTPMAVTATPSPVATVAATPTADPCAVTGQSPPAAGFAASFATALAYGWGGLLAIRHRLDLGTVVALVSYLARIYAPLVGLSNIQVSVMTALVSFERVFEVLDLPPMIQEKPAAVALRPGPARVSFEHVYFRYPAATAWQKDH